MLSLIRLELLKTFRKLRTYIGFALILVFVPIMYWGMSLGGEEMVAGMTRGLQQNFIFSGRLFNGWFVANLAMNALFIHIPFLIVLVAGDVFAGEATGGTFRMLLTRPPSRTKMFAVKAIGTLVYTNLLVLFMAVLSLGLGVLLFGSGDLLSFGEEGMTVFSAGEAFGRFLLAYGLAAFSMGIIAALAMLFSTIVENAIGPIIGSMAVVILFLIIGNLPFEVFDGVRPWLFTSYLDVWRRAFTEPMDGGAMLKDLVVLGIHFVLFLGSAWVLFTRKEILS